MIRDTYEEAFDLAKTFADAMGFCYIYKVVNYMGSDNTIYVSTAHTVGHYPPMTPNVSLVGEIRRQYKKDRVS